MKKEKDISGLRFGRLTAVKSVGKKNGFLFWLFKCDCGKYVEINKGSVLSGRTKSCGCYHNDVRHTATAKHNESNTRLYQCWRDMKVRCFLKTNKNFSNWGGRGITVCDEWKDDYIEFSKWAKNNGYKDDLTLDRINVNGNYCPENCRWITFDEQARNKRNNRTITFDGKTMVLAEWLRFFGIKNNSSFSYYKNKGFSDSEVLSLLKNKKIKKN